ncbi:unnamed protein product, partial [Ectocarpus sp. 13 AM-2016]
AVLQILPAVTESGGSGQVSFPGGGAGGSRSINVNYGNSVDDWQEISAWANTGSDTGVEPPTNPAKLRTRLGMKEMRVIPVSPAYISMLSRKRLLSASEDDSRFG